MERRSSCDDVVTLNMEHMQGDNSLRISLPVNGGSVLVSLCERDAIDVYLFLRGIYEVLAAGGAHEGD